VVLAEPIPNWVLIFDFIKVKPLFIIGNSEMFIFKTEYNSLI